MDRSDPLKLGSDEFTTIVGEEMGGGWRREVGGVGRRRMDRNEQARSYSVVVITADSDEGSLFILYKIPLTQVRVLLGP